MVNQQRTGSDSFSGAEQLEQMVSSTLKPLLAGKHGVSSQATVVLPCSNYVEGK